MKKREKVTKAHYEKFKERCRYWSEKFGLAQWDINFELKNIAPNQAEAQPDMNTLDCPIRLHTEWVGYSPKDIDMLACHECLHVVLTHLSIPLSFYSNTDRVNEAEHKIINVLIKLLIKDGKK